MTESTKLDLRTLAPIEWYNDASIIEVLFVFFPTSAISLNTQLGRNSLIPAMNVIAEYPLALSTVDFPEGVEVRDLKIQRTYNSDGMQVQGDFQTKHIGPGHYLLLMAPIRRSSDGTSEDGNTYSAILSTVGALCARFGHSVVLERALELRYSTEGDRQSQTSQAFENFWVPSDFQHMPHADYTLLFDKISSYCPPELRQRLRTGFRFLGNTAGKFDPLYRFVNAWIALEVVCGSAGKAVVALKALAPAEFADDAKRIKDARDDLFHNGIVYHMSYHEEHWLFVGIFWHVAEFYNLSSQVSFSQDYFSAFIRGKQIRE